jgi:RecJ-like exonuclease
MIKLRILLPVCLIGIFGLIILSNMLKPPVLTINKINLSYLEKTVEIQGKIINLKENKNSEIITIKDSTGEMTALVFNKISLKNNSEVKVIGKVQEYNNKTEIMANKIIEVDNLR